MKMQVNIPDNKSSRLLTNEENGQIFKLLGNRCQTISTTVIQLFCTEPPYHSQWLKKDVGVLCFVKDNMKKNYFFRLFCLKRNNIVWEHEMYTDMDYIESTDFLHIFEGEEALIAFNFASIDEAKEYKAVVDQKILLKRKRKEKHARQQINKQTNNNSNIITTSLNVQDLYNFKKTVDPAIKQAKRKRNITKADIGSPSDFKHISHVGWNPNSGFDIDCQDAQLKVFFEKAGVSEKQLQDHDTRKFIYDFINKHGGLPNSAAVEEDSHQQQQQQEQVQKPTTPVPPVPPRGSGSIRSHVRAAPPPPPMKLNQEIKSTAPSPPPMPTDDNFEPPFAPPLPPPMENSNPIQAPAPPALNSALLDSIRSGTNLKPVEDRKVTHVDDSRNDLLSEIRKGCRLKPVCERNIKPLNMLEQERNDLAGALARALAERSKVIHSEDDDGSDDEDDSNEDEWE